MKKLTIIGIAAWFTYWCIFSLCLISPAYAEKIPALSEIPAGLSLEVQAQLSQQKQNLEKELADFQAAAAVFNAKDAKDQSDSEYERLDAWKNRYINKAKAFNQAVKDKQVTETRQKGWQKALGCAMQEVYSRAELLGPDGISFAQDLRNEMKRVFNEAGQSVKDKDDVNIVNLKLDRQLSTGSGSNERQFIVEVVIASKGNGEIDVDVQSYFSKSQDKKDKQEYLQSILVLNKYGEVIKGDKSAAVNACLTH